MNLLIIGNPIAGGANAGPRIDELVGLLRGAGHRVEPWLTGAAGDAERFAAELPSDIDRLVVVGGDGTLHEVLNGLRDPAATPIVQMPAGTANVLVRELRLPWKPAEVAALVVDGQVKRFDIGEISGPLGRDGQPLQRRRFLLMLSCGFDAMVIEDIARTRKGKLRLRGYIRPLLRTMRRYRPPALSITVDGGEPVHGALVVVSNSKNYAGLLSVADRAAMDSGVFDVCLLPRATVPSLLRYTWFAWRRRISSRADVTYLNGLRVRIESEPAMAVEADGEYVAVTPVEATMRPALVPIVVPMDG